jgi:formyltetrahydrofolate deformylase
VSAHAPPSSTADAQRPSDGQVSAGALELENIGRLRIQCHDQPGVVAAVASLLAELGGNIIELGQFSTDPRGGRFFQRTVFHLPELSAQWSRLESRLTELSDRLGLTWELSRANRPKRVGIMVSQYDHCVIDLLWRAQRGEISMDPVMVIGNHAHMADVVRTYAVPFIHTPVSKSTRNDAERRHLELLQGNVDVVVLARYMQILSADFLQQVGCPIINVHHSFLPAFIGANPYAQAKKRGVKLIGATAHYATEELDEGPIIEQDVIRVSHAHTAVELQRYGANVERAVLGRALTWHCEDRVFRYENSTVVL